MIDAWGAAALGLVCLEWLGLGWLSGLSLPGPPLPGTWALRVLVGACLVGAAQLILALAGVGFASIPLVVMVAAGGAAALRLARRGASGAGCQAKQQPLARGERLGWLLLGLVLLAATLRSLLVPEAGWDAYSHWGLRAQAFATAGTLVDAHSEHEYYPPLVPLLEAWLYLHRGAVSIDLGKTIWAVIGSAFGVTLAWHLRPMLSAAWLAPWVAAGIVLGTPALLESFWAGQADLALTALLTLATLALVRWQQAPSREWLVQAALFGGAAGLTKFEGLPRIGVLVTALAVEAVLSRQWRVWQPALAIGAAAAVGAALWLAAEISRGIAPNAEHLGAFQPLAIGSVLLTLLAVFGGLRTGGGLLVAALAWAMAGSDLLRSSLRLLVLVVVGQLSATLLGFLLSSTAPDAEVRTSATRLFMQFMPLALLAGAVGLSRRVHL